MPLPEKFLKLQGRTPRRRSTSRASGLFTNIWVCRFATRKVSFLLPYYRYFSKKFVILRGNSRKITREINGLSPKVKTTFWKDPHPVWMIRFILIFIVWKNREKRELNLSNDSSDPNWDYHFATPKIYSLTTLKNSWNRRSLDIKIFLEESVICFWNTIS